MGPARLLRAASGLVVALGVVGVAACHVDALPGEGERVFAGATLVDGTGADAVEDAVLHVADGEVVCAGTEADCPVPEGVEVEDLGGRWVVPGLVDAHVHFAQTGWADGRPDGFDVTDDHPYDEVIARQLRDADVTQRSYLCAGVTAVFDVGGFPWTLGLRAPQAVGGTEMASPHVAATGPLLTWVEPRLSLPAEQSMVQVEEPDEGRDAVAYVDAFGADAAKVWFLGAPEDRQEALDETVEAMGEEAEERGTPFAVHATTLREAEVAVEAGADVLVHSVSDEVVSEAFLEGAAEAGTIYVPTLLVSENWGELTNHAALGEAPELDDPLGCVDPGTRERIASTGEYRDHPAAQGVDEDDVAQRRAAAAEVRELMAENLRRVHEAGVEVAAGTDAGNPLTVHGASIHPELMAMQDAGLEPEEVLVMATRNGARAMGREDRIGTLEPGKSADFLVLEASPLEDVGNLRELSHVARAGRLVAQEELSFR